RNLFELYVVGRAGRGEESVDCDLDGYNSFAGERPRQSYVHLIQCGELTLRTGVSDRCVDTADFDADVRKRTPVAHTGSKQQEKYLVGFRTEVDGYEAAVEAGLRGSDRLHGLLSVADPHDDAGGRRFQIEKVGCLGVLEDSRRYGLDIQQSH